VKKARGAFEFKHPEVSAKILKQKAIAYFGLIFMGRNEKTAGLKDPHTENEPKATCPFCKKHPCNQIKTMVFIFYLALQHH